MWSSCYQSFFHLPFKQTGQKAHQTNGLFCWGNKTDRVRRQNRHKPTALKWWEGGKRNVSVWSQQIICSTSFNFTQLVLTTIILNRNHTMEKNPIYTYQKCQIISKESSNDLSNFEVNSNSLVLLAYQQRTILKVICKKSIDKAQ